jgi:hypothetical protein
LLSKRIQLKRFSQRSEMECAIVCRLKEKECCICMETLQSDKNIAITQCGHTFCLQCLLIHFTDKNSCPLCRMTLINNADLNPISNSNSNSHPDTDISESFPDLLPIPSPMRSPFRIVSHLFQHGPNPSPNPSPETSPETSQSSSPSSQQASQITSSIPDLIQFIEPDIESDASEDTPMTPPRSQRVRRMPDTPRRPHILRINTQFPTTYPPSIIRNPVRCSNCNAMGHNRRTCPLMASTISHNQYC